MTTHSPPVSVKLVFVACACEGPPWCPNIRFPIGLVQHLQASGAPASLTVCSIRCHRCRQVATVTVGDLLTDRPTLTATRPSSAAPGSSAPTRPNGPASPYKSSGATPDGSRK
jgi:hypothetical protein